eukprot:TRINITY_DN1499_c0_g1_i1.p1 TRINITY_DN1499_c0_g1~~TRINITY_DN1499_c0_g1_i1.p1  ORF type:complete len:307 (-),score=44.50 TRINITY_DN1499_c0_g1_i1:722-1642(-)
MISKGQLDPEKIKVGMRINPQVGLGKIEYMSTAGSTSKFGIAFQDYFDQIVEAFLTHKWLCGVHVHVGSQGCDFDLICKGIKVVVDLAVLINKKKNSNQVFIIDIGGGLPVNFDGEEVRPSFQEYSGILRSRVPELFSGQYQVITEFGRALVAKAGFVASRVEYTKVSGGRHIATIQVGADLFVRTVYLPDKWPLRVSIVSSTGEVKNALKGEETVEWDIAGPCCNSGDIVAYARRLTKHIVPGDFAIIHDTGAYYHSSHSKYNSRPTPWIFAVEEVPSSSQDIRITLWKANESLHEVLHFFTSYL